MTANNQIVLVGRAGNNPAEDSRTTKTGSKIGEVRIAVNRPGKDQMGNTITDWISCQFWNKNAERLCEFVHKGDLISVSGSLRVDNWERDGQKRQKYYVHGESFQMLESRQAREERKEAMPAGVSRGMPKQELSADDYHSNMADDDELPPF